MKLRKTEAAALALTLAFVFFTGGYLLGRTHPAGILPDGGTPSVIIERSGDTIAPADASEPEMTPNASQSTEPSSGETGASDPETVASPAAYDRININTASKAELTDLHGIGDALAGRIIEYREKNGAFGAPEDIMNVSGIGEKTFAAICDYITVG